MHPNTVKRTKTRVYGPMVWIGCTRCEKFWSDFVARTFSLIIPVQPILHIVLCNKKWSQIHLDTMKHTKTWVYGPMVWIGCARCEKFWSDFVARTFALIAPVQPILHWASWSKEIIPNPPRHYETHQNMSFGLDCVDRVELLQKVLTRLCGTNICINCTSSAHFALSLLP